MYEINQSQQEINKQNPIRKHSVGRIRNPKNSHCWRNQKRYAQYTNNNPKQVELDCNLYSLYSRKMGPEQEVEQKGTDNSPHNANKSPHKYQVFYYNQSIAVQFPNKSLDIFILFTVFYLATSMVLTIQESESYRNTQWNIISRLQPPHLMPSNTNLDLVAADSMITHYFSDEQYCSSPMGESSTKDINFSLDVTDWSEGNHAYCPSILF